MRISDWSSDVCSSDLEGPVREKAPDVSEFEDERSGEFARLHGRGVAVLGPVSFKIALVAIDLVEMIKKMIEFGFSRAVAREVHSCFKLAIHLALDRESFPSPICHDHCARSAEDRKSTRLNSS